MKQQQVNEVFLVVHFQAVLAADKGEHAAHGAEEILDAGDQRPLQLPFGVLCAEFQKIEDVLVFDGQLGLGAQFRGERLVEIGLAEQRFLI